MPWTEDLADEVSSEGGADLEPFWKLRLNHEQFVVSLARRVPVMYLETEYFGGVGTQSAAVWDAGALERRTYRGNGAINGALRSLGVQATPPLDEFDTMLLGSHRSTDGWVDAAGEM